MSSGGTEAPSHMIVQCDPASPEVKARSLSERAVSIRRVTPSRRWRRKTTEDMRRCVDRPASRARACARRRLCRSPSHGWSSGRLSQIGRVFALTRVVIEMRSVGLPVLGRRQQPIQNPSWTACPIIHPSVAHDALILHPWQSVRAHGIAYRAWVDAIAAASHSAQAKAQKDTMDTRHQQTSPPIAFESAVSPLLTARCLRIVDGMIDPAPFAFGTATNLGFPAILSDADGARLARDVSCLRTQHRTARAGDVM